MIDVENYYNDFKPEFNKERYMELMRDPPQYLETEQGTISIDKRVMKSVVGGCRMLWKEFDRNHIYYGGEGTGKSHTAFQHAFVWWWVLNELGMINYEFTMENIIYGRIKHMMAAFDRYSEIPFVVYVLDESEELNRNAWNKPEVKEFMSKLRRERKNLRIVNLILPALEEILPSIALSRINWIFELDLEFDKNLTPIRGKYFLFNIPHASSYFSPMQGRRISRKDIKSYLSARFYDNDKKFENLPKKLLTLSARTNKVFIFDKQEYKQWSLKINTERDTEDDIAKDPNKIEVDRKWLRCYILKEGGQSITDIARKEGVARSTIADWVSKVASAIVTIK